MTDNQFKYKMHNHSSDFPEDMWDRISEELPEKKKKSRYFILFFFLLFAVLSVWTLIEVIGEQKDDFKAHEIDFASSEYPWNKSENYERIYIPSHKKSLPSSQPSVVQVNNKAVTLSNEIIFTKNDNDISTVVDISDQEKIEFAPREKFKEYGFLPSIASPEVYLSKSLVLTDPQGSCPKFKNDKSHPSFTLGFNLNTSLPYRNLSAITSLAYLEKSNASTSPVFSEGIGVNFGINLNKRYSIYTGVNYQMIKESFNAQLVDSSQVRVTTVIDYVYDDGAIVDSVMRTDEEYSAIENQSYRNKESLIEIPIAVAYTFNPDAKTKFAIKGGVQVTLSKPLSSIGWNEAGNDVKNSVVNDANGAMKYRGFGTFAGFEMKRALSKNTNLNFGANVRYLSYKNQGIKNSILLPGLSVGLSLNI